MTAKKKKRVFFSFWVITRKVPWIELAQVELRNDGSRQGVRENLPPQVLNNQLLVGGVEPKPRRELHHTVLNKVDLLHGKLN